MYLFDSNIFLEILLQQERADAAQKALEEMSSDRPGVVTGFALHAIEVISTRAGEFEVLSKFMQFLRNYPFLKRYDTTTEEERKFAEGLRAWRWTLTMPFIISSLNGTSLF